MKTLVLILLVVAGAIASGFYFYKSPTTSEIHIVRDVTDKHLSLPDTNEIAKLINLTGENKWNGAELHYSSLSDVSYNKSYVATIEKENKWLSNELERTKKIKRFQNDFTELLAQSYADSIGKSHSSVYLPLVNELKHLYESHSEKRLLLVYSDLMENDEDVSFYDEKTFALLSSDPDSIVSLLNKKATLPRLDGIEINVVYQPLNQAKDAEFLVVSEFYRMMLEGKGARVNISANLAN